MRYKNSYIWPQWHFFEVLEITFGIFPINDFCYFSKYFLWNIFYSSFKGEEAGDNPWKALTPEWLTSSPPPVENWVGDAPLVTQPYGYGKEKVSPPSPDTIIEK